MVTETMTTPTATATETVTVLEASQGIPCAAIEGRRLAEFEDSPDLRVRRVAATARPPWGTTWFRAGDDGRLVAWKYNWDCGD